MMCDGCSWMKNSEGDAKEAWLRFGRRGRCWKCQRRIIAKWRREDPEKHASYLLKQRRKRRLALGCVTHDGKHK